MQRPLRAPVGSSAVLVGLAIFAILATVKMAAADASTPETVRAFSVWHTDSKPAPVSNGESTLSGTVQGPFYIDTQKGPVNSGLLSCQAMVRIKADKTQEGNADCTITAKDGAQITAKLTCTGVFLVGCSGDFKLTGGTDRFKNISGGGRAVVRSDFADLQQKGADPSQGLQSGIIYFPALKYHLAK